MQRGWKKGFSLIFPILLITASITIFQGGASPATDIRVDYKGLKDIVDLTLTSGKSFSINVSVSDVSNLWGYTVRIGYNASVLTPNNFTSYDPFTVSYPFVIDDSGVEKLRPDGNGLYQNWTGGDYAKWKEVTADDDASYVYTTATNRNQTSSFGKPRLLPSWDAVKKVRIVFVARQTTGDEMIMPIFVIGIGGSVYNGSTVTPSQTYTEFSGEWAKNPATGSDWTWSDIENLEAGVKSVQNGATFDGELRVTQIYAEVYHVAGFVTVSYSMPFGTPSDGGKSGTFPLVKIYFTVDALGLTDLDLYSTSLTQPNATPISHADIDGSFTNIYIHDIVAKSATLSKQRIPTAGETISIDVTIADEGDFNETFYVTLTYDGTLIDNQTDVFLDIQENITLTFNWDTTGVANGEYTLRANATLPGETRPDNNVLDVKFRIGVIRDVAVVSVTPDPTEVFIGESVLVTVVVKNQGNFTESFTVRIKYADTVIDTKPVNDLATSTTNSVPFNWETASVVDGTYVVTAEAVIDVDDDLSNNSAQSINVKVGTGGIPMWWIYTGIAVIAIIVAAIIVYIIYRARKRRREPQS